MDKNISWISFKKFAGERVAEIILLFLRNGVSLTLVGSSSRAYLSGLESTLDFDFEIRPSSQEIKHQDLEKQLTNWLNDLGILPVASAGFGVMKFSFNNITVEFSPPRLESYHAEKAPFGHSDFTASINYHLDHQSSFARRDFTLNSIGLHFIRQEKAECLIQLLDPYKGLVDLQSKVLRPISDAFYNDPVRFLRMIRFHLQHGYTYHPQLLENLGRFDLTKLSTYYLYLEGDRVQSLAYLREFFYLIDQYKIPFPKSWEIFRDLLCSSVGEGEVKSMSNPLGLLQANNLDFFKLKVSELEKIFSLKKHFLKSSLVVIDLLMALPQNWSAQISQFSKFDQFKNKKIVQNIFTLRSLWKKNCEVFSLLLGNQTFKLEVSKMLTFLQTIETYVKNEWDRERQKVTCNDKELELYKFFWLIQKQQCT